jgi:hypothetical protein
MGNRCPDCNKFVGLEPQEPDADNLSIDGDGDISGSVKLSLACSECGADLKEITLDVEYTCQEALDHADEKHDDLGEDFYIEWEIEVNNSEVTDRYQTTDRDGHLIKNLRYQKHFYGYNTNVTVSCPLCGWDITLDLCGEAQASEFEVL